MSFYKEFLNEIEIAQLEGLNDNPTLFNAIQKVILAGIYFNGTLEKGKKPEPLRNFMLQVIDNAGHEYTDAELGARQRAIRTALDLLSNGIKGIETFKRVKPNDKDEKTLGT